MQTAVIVLMPRWLITLCLAPVVVQLLTCSFLHSSSCPPSWLVILRAIGDGLLLHVYLMITLGFKLVCFDYHR